MERTLDQVRQILYALSLRNPEAGYTPNQIEILAQEFHEDMGCISAEALQEAYIEIRKTFIRFPKYAELVEVARMKEQPMVSHRKLQIEEDPTYKSDIDIERNKKGFGIIMKILHGEIKQDDGEKQIKEMISSGTGD